MTKLPTSLTPYARKDDDDRAVAAERDVDFTRVGAGVMDGLAEDIVGFEEGDESRVVVVARLQDQEAADFAFHTGHTGRAVARLATM